MGRKLLLSSCLAALIAYFYITNSPKLGKIVKIQTGEIQGIISKSRDGRDFYEWLGIPYAEPPVGDLRYASPKPVKGWEGVRQTVKNGAKCAQVELLTWRLIGEEDCLFLNVHVPKINGNDELPKGLPVMMWIHGGGFNMMGADDYRPEYFMDQDVILVVINYRLGNFGFLSTGDSVIRGNMGLKDQLMALKWVNKNIESFGGDRKQITIFGESAGAASTHYHMLSPKARGLFTKVISQSGTASTPFAIDTPEVAKGASLRFASSVGCNFEDSTEMVNCLRGMSKTELLKATVPNVQLSSILKPHLDGHMLKPTVEVVKDDEAFITEHPLTILEQGKAARVPWLTGVTADEGLVTSIEFYRDENSLRLFEADWNQGIARALGIPPDDKRLPEIAEKIRHFYFPTDQNLTLNEKLDQYTHLFSDTVFNSHLSHAANIQRQFSPTYLYHYSFQRGPSFAPLLAELKGQLPVLLEFVLILTRNYVRSVLFGEEPKYYGVGHGDDIPMLFISPGLFHVPKNEHDPKKSDLYRFSNDMVKLWVDFAKDKKNLEFRGVKLQPQVKGQGPLEYLDISDDPKVIRAPFEKRVSVLFKSLNSLWTN